MSYLEELLPELRKGAKIRNKKWEKGNYYILKNGWQKFGCFYVYDIASGSFLLNEYEFSYQCGCCGRKSIIKTDLNKRQMEQIIKIIGAKQ